MYSSEMVIQDGSEGYPSTVLNALRRLAQDTKFSQFRTSVAYASKRGCEEFNRNFSETTKYWIPAEKRWLVSIDFGQTSPGALAYLADLPSSQVRIADGLEVLENNLFPRRAFHPKTFVASSGGKIRSADIGMISGSANLTFGALHSNAEHVFLSRRWGAISKLDTPIVSAIALFSGWWTKAWASATPLNRSFIKRYRAIYDPKKQLQDAEKLSQIFASAENAEVGTDEGVKWATSKCFWIETHHLYENFGHGRPGNQLDCRRGTRVFFGFQPRTVAKNTVLGQVELIYKGKESQLRSIRFANNAMDKVNLPVPEEFGPSSYDDSVLHFERTGDRQYALTSGTAAQARKWKKKSEQQGLAYELAGGREYGFYS